MSRSSHSSRARTVGKIRRASSNRASVRTSIHAGRYDDLETFSPTHAFRTGVQETS